MQNKTVVFDAQKEIADLKRRVSELERGQPSFWPTYQPPSVPGYPPQTPIFGPQDIPPPPKHPVTWIIREGSHPDKFK